MKLVENIAVLQTVTKLDLDAESVLNAAIEAKPKCVIVIGEDTDGGLYFASSVSDGGTVLWWMEKAKRALMEISE